MEHDSTTYQASRIVTVAPDQAGQRIDNFLFNHLKNIPKTRIYKMLRKGEVRVNKGRIKPVYRIQAGDQVRLPPVTVNKQTPKVFASLDKVSHLNNQIIYESDRMLVLNKVSGMAVHGGSGDSFGVIEGLRALRPDAHYLELVHRLDKHTSGCLMIAKRRSTLRYLHEQLRTHKISKIYNCWVIGEWPDKILTVSDPLKTVRSPNGDRRSIVDKLGKESRTDFKVLEYRNGYTLLQAKPHSGRMHQIRVHCAHTGYPICGDEKYAHRQQSEITFDRLYLHAHKLTFSEKIDLPSRTIVCDSSSFDAFINRSIR